MKKQTIVIVLCLATVATVAMAQHGRGAANCRTPLPEALFPAHNLDRMADILDLTGEQRTAIEELRQQGREQGLELRKEVARLQNQFDGEMLADEPSSKTLVDLTEKIGALRTQLQVIRLKTRLAVRDQLTDEQRDQWVLRGQKHGRHGLHRGHAPQCQPGPDRGQGHGHGNRL